MMQQLVFAGPRSLQWREAPEPRLSSDEGALVRPIAVATCDLDSLIVSGTSPFQAPFPLGHECVAEVVEAGDAAGSLAAGPARQRPLPDLLWQLRRMPRRTHLQLRRGPVHVHLRIRSRGRQVGRLPVGPGRGALRRAHARAAAGGPRALGGGQRLGQPQRRLAHGGPPLAEHPGADVLVVGGAGPGSIGLYAAGAGRRAGSGSVLYVDGDVTRREIAARLGAQTLAEKPKRVGPYPITVDSSADPDGLELALRSTSPDGVCTSTAIYFGEQPRLPLLEMYTKGITFRTGRANARSAMPHVLGLAAAGHLHPELVTSRVVGWDEAPAALAEGGWTKLVIERG